MGERGERDGRVGRLWARLALAALARGLPKPGPRGLQGGVAGAGSVSGRGCPRAARLQLRDVPPETGSAGCSRMDPDVRNRRQEPQLGRARPGPGNGALAKRWLLGPAFSAASKLWVRAAGARAAAASEGCAQQQALWRCFVPRRGALQRRSSAGVGSVQSGGPCGPVGASQGLVTLGRAHSTRLCCLSFWQNLT